MPEEVEAHAVLEAIRLVSEELSHGGISKDRSNQQQGYKFRGIDDCLNALSGLLPKHHLVILPSVLERTVVERQTKSGGALFYVTVKARFDFFSTLDGSIVSAETFGEAMDSADKATNKAMSASYKYAVLLTFCIPTEGVDDADAVTHDVAQSTTKHVAVNHPEQAQKMKEKLENSSFDAQVKLLGELTKQAAATQKPQASLAPTGSWVVPFGKNKGQPLTDLLNDDVEYLLRYYAGKLQDPANTSSRYRDEWEAAAMAVRAELLTRDGAATN